MGGLHSEIYSIVVFCVGRAIERKRDESWLEVSIEARVSKPERSDFWLEGEGMVPTHGGLPGTKRKEKTT